MNIRLYKVGDYDAIEDSVEPIGRPADENLILEYSVSLTVEDEGKIVACGGIIYDTDTHGILWLKLSYNITKKPVSLVKILKKGLEIIIDSFEFERVTAQVKENFSSGQRLVIHFGFIPTKETFIAFDDTYRIYELWQQ